MKIRFPTSNPTLTHFILGLSCVKLGYLTLKVLSSILVHLSTNCFQSEIRQFTHQSEIGKNRKFTHRCQRLRYTDTPTILKFNNHILDIVKKANQRVILIHISFSSKNTTNLLSAYKVYVRPLLEYATPV